MFVTMFTRKRRRAPTHAVTDVPRIRGGVSLPAILTGVVVALGAMVLLSAIVGGILAAVGSSVEDVSTSDAVNAGIGVGITFVVATFLAYLWGGYTAGRMGRGAGFANGLLVPLVAVIVGFAVAALVHALGADPQLNLPGQVSRLPVDQSNVVDFGTGIGIATLVAMFLGLLRTLESQPQRLVPALLRGEDRNCPDRESKARGSGGPQPPYPKFLCGHVNPRIGDRPPVVGCGSTGRGPASDGRCACRLPGCRAALIGREAERRRTEGSDGRVSLRRAQCVPRERR